MRSYLEALIWIAKRYISVHFGISLPQSANCVVQTSERRLLPSLKMLLDGADVILQSLNVGITSKDYFK